MNWSTLNFSGKAATPLVLQTEAAECGLACLAMVAGHHGFRTDLASLRQRHPISLKGSSLANLMDIAARMDLNARALKPDLDDLNKLALPAILHWDFNHFVVLLDIDQRHAMIHDPARGARRMGRAELSKHFTGVALELDPSPDFSKGEALQTIGLKRLWGRVPGLCGAVLQVFLLAAALETVAIAGPFYVQWVVDSVIVAEDRDLLTVLGLGFLLLLGIKVAVGALRSWVLMVLGTTLNLRLLGNLFHHLLHLPMVYFEKRHLGDISSRFESLNVIQRTLTSSFIEAVVDGVMALATLVLMAVYSLKLAVVASIAACLYGLLRHVLYGPQRQAAEEQILHMAKQQSHFLESVRGMQSVKLFNRQLQRRVGYQNLAVDNFNAGIRLQKLNILFHALNLLLFGMEHIAVVWIGALLVLDGGFSVGMLFAFMAYKEQFSARTAGFIEKGVEFRMLGLHLERVADIALTEQEKETGDWTELTALPSAIEVRDLGFRYSESEPWILHGLNLSIEEGESVAIVGPSGCGKTTLLKVLLGLLPPSTGEVRFGGVSLARLPSAKYRERVAAVMQDDQLFAGSLADNISFFDPQPDLDHIRYCAGVAAVQQDIEAMPMGYNTLVGDMGTTLSGGQKQRILLARALYKRPTLLLLDEATSHLDVHREKAVNEAIRQLKLTRIIIAHRPETIASADRVVVLGQSGSVAPSHQPIWAAA